MESQASLVIDPSLPVSSHGVQVSCRFRCQNEAESMAGGTTCVSFPDNRSFLVNTTNATTRHTAFDNVFSGEITQEEVYKRVGAPFVKDLLSGYNCTILAYGQTGSGKTFTTLGDKNSKGLIPRLIESIFEELEKADGTEYESEVRASFVELYQEKIRDLLFPQSSNLRIREDKERGIWIDGVAEISLSNVETAMNLLTRGNTHRVIGSTQMNADSSRSHAVFTISVMKRHISSQVRETGKLFVVDLAGSEMAKKTAATGRRLEEAKVINRSLSALGNVIYSLTDSKSKHVPYRDSKLTRLLQNSLGGNSKTHLLLTCSSSSINLEETMSTIRFGSRAKFIRNDPHVNREKGHADYKEFLATLEGKIENLTRYISRLEKEKGRCEVCHSTECRDEVSSLSMNQNETFEVDHSESSSIDILARSLKCDICNESSGEMVECDGCCGFSWHVSCLKNRVPTYEAGEYYCETCEKKNHSDVLLSDVLMQEEMNRLRKTISEMRNDRFQIEHQQQLEKHLMCSAEKSMQSVHRFLEDRVRGLELQLEQERINSSNLLAQFDGVMKDLQSKEKDAERMNLEILRMRREQKLWEEGKTAETEILRRQIDIQDNRIQSLESELQSKCREVKDLQNKLDVIELEEKSQKEDSLTTNSKKSESFDTLLPEFNGSPRRAARPYTAVESSKDHSKGTHVNVNIQNWWSGGLSDKDSGEMEREHDPSQATCLGRPLDVGNDAVPKPLRARLVGLLNSLEEEASCYKDLGEKLAYEVRSSTSYGTRRPQASRGSRNLLPLISKDEFIEEIQHGFRGRARNEKGV